MEKFFNSKYPILAAPMNKVSYAEFALVQHQAGIFPSIMSYCYYKKIGSTFSLDFDTFIPALQEYVKLTGSPDVLICVDYLDLSDELIKVLAKLQISHIAISGPDSNNNQKTQFADVGKVITQQLKCKRLSWYWGQQYRNSDGLLIKGKESGGRTSGLDNNDEYNTLSIMDRFKLVRNQYPTSVAIPMGGIGTSRQVKEYLELGATAVGIGTLLAASKESVLTPEVKNAMINATWNDIVTLDDRLKQNALVFSQVVSKDVNNTFSLTTGISSKADQGHIFAGAGIDYIKEIKPMKQIIEELMNF